MPCYYPIEGWRADKTNENGKRPLVFDIKKAQQDEPIKIACGQCTGCKLERSRQWAIRCLHESTLHEDNVFLTLTYDEDSLPETGTLYHPDFQKFMKRLRKRIAPKQVRFFMCGEYGNNQDLTSLNTIGRPHYHVILFGHDFSDKQEFTRNFEGEIIYRSDTLEALWPHGFSSIGEVTFESAAYVARYCLKKITGEDAQEHYETISPYGEIEQLRSEYSTQSNRPGIARQWFEKYRKELDKGFITIRGVKMPAPKYYHDMYSQHYEEDYEPIQEAKRQSIDFYDPENMPNRLRVKEQIKLKRISELKRTL